MRAALVFFVVGVYFRETACHPDNGVKHAVGSHGNVGVFGGHQITIEQAPFVASIRGYHGGYHFQFHVCSASIVDERFLLTAASCVDPHVEYKAEVGTDQRNGDGGELINIDKYYFHPRYNKVTGEYDFLLVELKKPVTFSSKVAKVNLPPSDFKLPTNTWLNVTGWGRTESKLTSLELVEVEITSMDSKACQEQYDRLKFTITRDMICAGYPYHGTCDSDKGAPLTQGNVQVGLTTSHSGCGELPGVYARISSARDWILETVRKHSAQ